jgi:hypothetical protein
VSGGKLAGGEKKDQNKTIPITREELLKLSDRKVEKVEVPEWGGHLYVRNMTAAERVEYDHWILGPDGMPAIEGVRVKLAIMTCCDEKGERLFKREDYPTLSERDGAAITRIFNVSLHLSGMGRNALAERIQELKNSRPSSSRTT